MGITRYQFAQELASALEIAPTQGLLDAIVAWETFESSNAANNPLSTEKDMGYPGQSDFNSVGVKNYANLAEGISATVATLFNGYYDPLITALQSGQYSQITQAVDASPWGDHGVSGITLSPGDYAALINSNNSSGFPDVPAVEPATTPEPVSVISVPVPSPAPAPDPIAGGGSSSLPASVLYTVTAGETLTSIAAKYQVNEGELYSVNESTIEGAARSRGFSSSNHGNLIWPGEVLRIP